MYLIKELGIIHYKHIDPLSHDRTHKQCAFLSVHLSIDPAVINFDYFIQKLLTIQIGKILSIIFSIRMSDDKSVTV